MHQMDQQLKTGNSLTVTDEDQLMIKKSMPSTPVELFKAKSFPSSIENYCLNIFGNQ